MRRIIQQFLLVGLLSMAMGASLHAQQIVDRIVARVENDIILESQLRGLARYQQFLEGKSETDAVLLDRLIDQWIVRTEAETAHFPRPSEADIQHGVERVINSFTSPTEYGERKKQSGLSDAEVRKIVAAQLYLSNYLDSRFRPSVQIDSTKIEDFYRTSIIPRAKTRGQEPPSLESAHDVIQEALVQRGIDEQAERWLKESRAHLHVEKISSGAMQ